MVILHKFLPSVFPLKVRGICRYFFVLFKKIFHLEANFSIFTCFSNRSRRLWQNKGGAKKFRQEEKLQNAVRIRRRYPQKSGYGSRPTLKFHLMSKPAFGKGRVLVHATFDGERHDGQLVRMQTTCHIIGIRKDIRAKISKGPGDTVHVTLRERKTKSGRSS